MKRLPPRSQRPFPEVGKVYHYDDDKRKVKEPLLVVKVDKGRADVYYVPLRKDGSFTGKPYVSCDPGGLIYMRDATAEECRAWRLPGPPLDPSVLLGITIVCSPYLSPHTMVVSPGLYKTIKGLGGPR